MTTNTEIKLLSLSLALLACFACGDDAPARGLWTGSVHDSAGITITENEEAAAVAWSFAPAPVLVIGGADAAAEAEFYQIIGAVLLPDSRVVIGDGSSGELRFFSASGAYLHTVGGRGGGPGEYGQLAHLTRFRDDTIVTYDSRRRVVSLLSDSGELARSIEVSEFAGVRTTFVGLIEDGSVALIDHGGIYAGIDPGMGAGDLEDDTVTITRIMPGSGQLDTVIRKECGTASIERVSLPGGTAQLFPFPLHFSPTPLVFVNGDHVVLGDCRTYSLDFYGTMRAGPDHIVRKRHGPVAVSQSDVTSLAQSYRDYLGEEANPFAQLTLEIAIGAPAEGFFPPYAGLPARPIVESEGSFWIPRYTPTISAFVFGEDPTVVESGWDVFDVRGRLSGFVEAPPGFHLLDLREGRAIGVQRTADDVEQVVVYQLQRIRDTGAG